MRVPRSGVPAAMCDAFPRLEVGEAEFTGLCDALKVSESVRENAWKKYESLWAADGALVSGGCGACPEPEGPRPRLTR